MPLAGPEFIRERLLRRHEQQLELLLSAALESRTVAGRHIRERTWRKVLGLDKAVATKVHFVVYPAWHSRRRRVAAFLSWLHGEAARG